MTSPSPRIDFLHPLQSSSIWSLKIAIDRPKYLPGSKHPILSLLKTSYLTVYCGKFSAIVDEADCVLLDQLSITHTRARARGVFSGHVDPTLVHRGVCGALQCMSHF